MTLKDLHDKIDQLEANRVEPKTEDTPPLSMPSFEEFCRALSIRKRGAKEDEALIKFAPEIWSEGQRRLAQYLVEHYEQKKPVRLIIHKIRQRAKISTMAQAWMLYRVHYQRERKAAVAAHLDISSREIFQNVHRFIENMPESLLKPMDQDRVLRQELKYSSPHNSTFMCASAGSVEAFRGGHVHYFHGSEVAFYQRPEQFFQAVSASFPGTEETWDSCVILEGTAKGRGYFYDRCQAAQKGEDEFDFVFYSWKDEPDCRMPLDPEEKLVLKESEAEYQKKYELDDEQMKWALHMVKNVCFGKWEVFHQEYPVVSELAFDYSGHPLIDREKAKEDRAAAPDPIFQGNITWSSVDTSATTLVPDEYGPLVIWEDPEPAGDYYIPIDIGEGLKADFTELPVLRYDDGEIRQVALFRSNKIKPDATGIIGFQLGAHYNWALLIPEQNGPGLNTCQVLRDGHVDDLQTSGGYPNLYYRERYEKSTREITRVMGFLTSRHNKQALLSKLGELYDKGVVVIRSKVALDQLAGCAKDPETDKMVQNHKDPETGLYHDDSVMSLGIGVFVISGEDRTLESGLRRFIHKPKRAGW